MNVSMYFFSFKPSEFLDLRNFFSLDKTFCVFSEDRASRDSGEGKGKFQS